MSHRRTTLFVAGIGSRTRARDLAFEFERYGRLVRCDIPAPRGAQAKPYAFVEYEDGRDAEDAYDDMQGRRVDGYTLNIQWAKNAPSRSWRYDDRAERPDRRGRSRSPPRRRRGGSRSRSPPPRRRSISPRGDKRSPSPRRRSPPLDDRRRSISPIPKAEDASPTREARESNGAAREPLDDYKNGLDASPARDAPASPAYAY
ncbi:hypothetical protein DFS34DRAFT_639174 [Phlyctochytrium arcticum]|nr:hypothetical protein DFS34DRAFT_639174 [Phlyctochytrium arcticum]